MNKNNKISVIIPCHPPDLKEINQALTSLSRSTVLPDEVIVALSETPKAAGRKLTAYYRKKYQFPIVFATTTKMQYAGQNRNRGAEIAKHNILVFFDADDLCHPQKIEITKYVFAKYQPKMFVHHFSMGSCPFPPYDLKKLKLTFSREIFKYTFGTPPKRQNANYIFTDRPTGPKWVGAGQPTHGHVTVNKSVFKKIKYSDLPRAQDVVFCLDVLWQTKSCIYAEANLICWLQ